MAGTGDILPFRQFVLKVHSRCDLACDHCYIYEHADSSWRTRPRLISGKTVAKVGERIAEHARQHALAQVTVILHGGEPLLAGPARLAAIARQLRRAVTPVCALDLRIHTNGVRLDEEFCEVFLAARVKVGVSLDGDRAGNDLHRRYRDGRSSYDQVIRAVGLLRTDRYRELYAGLLCTIDVRNDPVATYDALAALKPPAVDFLLPHATHDTPPPGAGAGRATPYGDWLAAVFDRWRGDADRVPVRMFESIIRTSGGAGSLTESLGLEPSDVAVIETDGAIEQADSLKVAYDGAPATGFDVFSHQLGEAALHPAIKARQLGMAGLSDACRRCPVVGSCGGGLYAHRYRTGSGFDNVSVYCADLTRIINHVRARLIPAAAAAASGSAARVAPQPSATLADDHFDAIAAGFGDADAVMALVNAQRRLRRALLELLRVRARASADALFVSAWAMLPRLAAAHPAELDHVLAHPYVRAWAERCLRDGEAASLPVDAAHLAAITAAAAVRAGAQAEMTVPVVEGYVHLPTLGRLRVGETSRTAEITVSGGAFQVRSAGKKWDVVRANGIPETGWQPVRELRSGPFAVRLEDTDPYRDCHQWPAAPRLAAEAANRWQQLFAVAWPLLESEYPAYAAGLAAGFSTITPLARHPDGRDLSAAARQASGAVGVALPADAESLALLLIHEFQHVKLGALLDMADLCAPKADGRLFYAPWRDDPRPAEALLQGAYAHLAVTDYWRTRRHRASGPEALAAADRFVRWRILTAEAVETLAGSGVLTEHGDRFVAGMRATIGSWGGERVPPNVEAAARRWADDQRNAWRRQSKVQKDSANLT